MRTRLGVIGAVIGAMAGSAHAQFFEGFDGPFENLWNDFPFANTNTADQPFIFYEGMPSGSFETIGGASVYYIANNVQVVSYHGMSPVHYQLDGSEDIVEARIYAMDGPSATSCGPITMRLMSPGGPTATVGLFINNPGQYRWRSGSSIQGTLTAAVGSWVPNTWYRLRLDDRGPTLRAWVLADDGTPLYSHDFGHTLEDMQIAGGGPDLYLAILQDGYGAPLGTVAEVAIDYVQVIEEACFADCDGNGALNVDDIDCFVAAFTGGDVLAGDCDGNYALNVDDIDCFVASFTGGCL